MFLYIVIVSNSQSLQQQAESGPAINTLYVPIGKLHPTSEYAGVLINLNVAEAIDQGNQALDVASTFLDNHRTRLPIDEFTGEHRVIHFLNLKRNQLKRNLQSLEADMQSVKSQFKMPKTSHSKVMTRSKRDIHLDISMDINEALSTIVTGIVSIFHSPQSLDKIQKSVDKIAYNTSRLEAKFGHFVQDIDQILTLMQDEMYYYKSMSYFLTSVDSALSIADQTIVELLNSITPLVQGKLTHNLLDPLRIHQLIDRTQQLADKYNLQVVATNPIDILRCSVTTFATSSSWFALLSLPLVRRSETMNAYQMINIPWFYHNQSVQWQFEDGIVASQPGLYPDINNVFVPQQDLYQVCEQFNENYLCHSRINRYPTCQISLMNNRTQGCALRLADHKIRYAFGQLNFLFFEKPTETLMDCSNLNETFTITYHGLINMAEFSHCTITTKNFTLLPKTSANTNPPSFTKTHKVIVLDNEWAKVAVQLNDRPASTTLEDQPFPPHNWQDWNITRDKTDEDIRVFGSYTILVNSIFMFCLIIVLLLIISLCVINYFNAIPDRFRSLPLIIKDPVSVEDDKEIASPAE